MENIRILDSIIRVEAIAGSTIQKAVSESYDFCVKYNVNIILLFNSKRLMITPQSDKKKLIDSYMNNRYYEKERI